MGTLIQVGQLLLSLSILVFVHEMGHFLAARMFGIRVKKFYLFFDFLFPMPNVLNFALFKFKKGDTEYGLGWFPMGGYVQIGGMVDESMDEEEMNAPVRDDDYRAKPVWQRFIVMIGGIVMNVIFGVLFYFVVLGFFRKEYVPLSELNRDGVYASSLAQSIGFKTGDKVIRIDGKTPVRADIDVLGKAIPLAKKVVVERNGNEVEIQIPGNQFKRMLSEPFLHFMHAKVYVDSVVPASIADKNGLQLHDTLLTIDSIKILNFDHFKEYMAAHPQKNIDVEVNRKGMVTALHFTTDTNGTIGFIPNVSAEEFYKSKSYSFGEILHFGIKDAFGIILLQLKGYSKMISGQLPVRESMSGPIGLTKWFSKTWDWGKFFVITSIISMALAFGNILPIPALDGGHMILLLIEGITGKPLNQKLQERIQSIGMIILLALMAFIFGNDILKLFGI